MSHGENHIKSSTIQRIKKIPQLSQYAINTYTNNGQETAGTINITVPGQTGEILVLDAEGIFAFGGIGKDNWRDNIQISKIIIDGITVFDYTYGSTNNKLDGLFQNSDDTKNVGGNTPPFLINHSIQIYCTNSNEWWPGEIFVSLAPIN